MLILFGRKYDDDFIIFSSHHNKKSLRSMLKKDEFIYIFKTLDLRLFILQE